MTKKQTLLWAVKKKKTSQLFAGTQSCILVNVPILLVPSFTSLRPTANYNEECLVGPFCQPVTHVLSMKKSKKY